jgi:hypothetical protein
MREVIDFFDFGCEGEFVEAAVRRLLDGYAVLMKWAAKNR